MLERLIPPGVLALAVCVAAGAVFAFGYAAGLKSGARAGAESVERVSGQLAACRASTARLSAAVAQQNAAVQAQADAALAAKAKAEAALAAARAEGRAERDRAARILSLKPAGDACAQAEALLKAYGE